MITTEEKSLVHISSCPHPFKSLRSTWDIFPGMSIAEILETVQPDPLLRLHSVVFLNDELIPPDLYPAIYTEEGDQVFLKMVPSGGGGGGDKDILSIFATIAIFAVGAYFTYGSFSGVLGTTLLGSKTFTLAKAIGATIGLVGSLAMSALAPPASSNLNSISDSSFSSSPSLSGVGNIANKFGPIPKVFGKVRMTPPLGALSTATIGQDQYLYMTVVWGYGPLEISDIKIGETAITDFSDVEIETVTGDTGDDTITTFPFTSDIYEEDVGVTMRQTDGWITRTTQPNTDWIGVDLTYLSGLVGWDNETGERVNMTVTWDIEFRESLGPGTWKDPHTGSFSVSQTERISDVYRISGGWSVTDHGETQGQFDVRIKRVTVDDQFSTTHTVFDELTWSILESQTFTAPISEPGLAQSAIKIRATDQLNGVVDQLSGVVEAKYKDWNGAAWVVQKTSNPASAFREVLQGPGNSNALADARLNLTNLQDFHDKCVAAGREFNMVVDFQTTVEDMLNDIAAAGRAKKTFVDGKWGVVVDEKRTSIIQHFTPRNSWGYEGNKIFQDLPHALRAKFQNRDKDWILDERIVYDDGYNADNATKFEELQLLGITDSNQVYKDSRYHIATGRLRPELHSFYADLEYIQCTRGDLIRFTHDVPLFGLGYGRVKSVTNDGVNVTNVELDDSVPMEINKTYEIRFRKTSDGSSTKYSVTANPGNQFNITFGETVSIANGPTVGDLYMFGVTGLESVELVVKDIEPVNDLSARLVCVDHAPGIYDADTTEIPPFDSQITIPPGADTPFIVDARSDETVLYRDANGKLQSRILISLGMTVNLQIVRVVSLQVQYRFSSSTHTWWDLPDQPATATQVTIAPVEDGQTYDVQLRYKFNDGNHGPYATLSNHIVTGKSNPPNDVTGFAITVRKFQLELTWNANSDLDLSEYEIRSGSATWGAATLITRTDALSHVIDVDQTVTGTNEFLIKALDESGNYSTTAANVTLTVTAPNAPSVATTIDGQDLVLSWTTNPGTFDILEHEIRSGGTTWGTATFVAKVTADSYRTQVNWSGSKKWWVAGIDRAGNTGTGQSVDVNNTASVVTQLTSQVIDNNILFRWNVTAGTAPVEHYELRKGTTFATAEVIGTSKTTFLAYFESASGSNTYWVVPIDTGGTYGTEQSVVVQVDEPPDFTLRNTFNTDFFGTRTNVQRRTDDRRAVQFDGVDDVFQVISDATLDIGASDFSIEFWFKPATGQSNNYYILDKYQDSSNYIRISLDTNQRIALGSKSSNITRVSIGSSNGAVTLGKRHHVAFVADRDSSANSKVYVDGVDVTSGTSTADTTSITNTAEYEWGKNSQVANEWFVGELDDVRIWSDVRTSAEISNNKDMELDGDEAGLIGYWRFNSIDSAGNVLDLTDSHRDGTLAGNPTILTPDVTIVAPVNITETYDAGFGATWQTDITAGKTIYAQDVPTTADIEQIFDLGAVASAARVVVNTTLTEIVSGGTMTTTISTKQTLAAAWTVHTAGTEAFATNFRYVRVKLAFTSDAKQMWEITKMNVEVKSKLITDQGTVTVSSNPETVTLNKTFADIESIALTPVGTTSKFAVRNGGTGSNPTTFDVYLFNDTGAASTGDVSWVVRGY